MANKDLWEWYKENVDGLRDHWSGVVSVLEQRVAVPLIGRQEIDKREDLAPLSPEKLQRCLADAKNVQKAIEESAGVYPKPKTKQKSRSTLYLAICLIVTTIIGVTIAILVLLHILY